MKFELTIPWDTVSATRKHVVNEFIQKTQIKGFRKGKAPAALVEEKVGEKEIIEHLLDHLLPTAYANAISEKKLKPLSRPRINPTSIKPKEDWKFEVEIAQKPEFKLGDYQKSIKSALAKLKKAKSDKKTDEKSSPDHDPQLVAIFDTILADIKFEVPELLVEEEADNQLSRLVNQIQKLGLTIDQYLASMKVTAEQLTEQYKKTARENLQLEFILQEIVTDLKIEVTDQEIDDLIKTVGDDHLKTHLNTPREREGLRYNLARKKAVEALKAL